MRPIAQATLCALVVWTSACGDDAEADTAGSAAGGGTTTASGTPGSASTGSSAGTSQGPAGSSGTGTGAGGDSSSSSSVSAGGSTSASSGSGGSGDDGIPGGGAVLVEEPFDDDDFASRGWYDGDGGAIVADGAPGSSASFSCDFAIGASSCTAGKPARHPVTPTDTVYLRFWMRFSENWVGSGVAYHPHMMHFLTDANDDYVGPAHTHLTTYTEVVGGRALLALQDSENVDLGCILKNDGSFEGCDGDFDSWPFTESRSVCACNGLVGDVDGHDCFPNGDGTWYSSRAWGSDGAFVDAAGPRYKGDWHQVEVYFAMSSIQGGVGVPDGRIRWVQDGEVLIASDAVLMRTNEHADMHFDQFAILPYIGVGSPIAQSFQIDDLVIATARP